MKLTTLELEVLLALRAHGESEILIKDKVWTSVYLDNAKPENITSHQFAGVLSSLEKKGLYESAHDGYFGYVLEEVAA